MTATAALTKRMERAALLLAEDQQTNEAIAAAVGISRQALDGWCRRPAFAARIAEHKARWAAEVDREGVANRQNRVKALNERWLAMQQVIAERAADPTMKAPGAATGLLVRTYKPGKFRTVEEYRFDAALVAELRAHEKQTAEELGQWVTTARQEMTGAGGGPLQHEVEHRGMVEVRAVDYRTSSAALRPVPAPIALGAALAADRGAGDGHDEGAA